MKEKGTKQSDRTRSRTGESGDEVLFDALSRSKRRKKVRRWITAIVILGLLAAGIYYGVKYGRQKLNEKYNELNPFGMMMPTNQVVPYVVDTGSVTTTVSGSGQLSDVGSEKLTLPAGVEVDKVLFKAGERVQAGQMLATVELSSVLSALSDVQSKIGELDGKLNAAAYDVAPTYINAGVNGRVKAVWAQAGDDVATVMVKNGALAILSIDGKMAVDIPCDTLAAGDTVTVYRENGTGLAGTVDTALQGTATVLVTDDGPAIGETLTVLTPGGERIEGAAYVHSPLRVTGYAGTVSYCNIRENQPVWIGNNLFGLRDTAYTANYESVLRQRREQEQILLRLMDIYGLGGIQAPFDGTVVSVEYKDPSSAQNAGSDTGSGYGDLSGLTGGDGESGGQTGTAETPLLTLSPDEEMTVNITVNETDILSLQVGQAAQITINSIDTVFPGTVTSISRLAADNSNDYNDYNYTGSVANYTAVITLDKDPRMLPGMSARAVIRIEGVENTILIPAAALHQTSDASFVYTSCDEETQELGGAVRVIPGLNDGNMVEIIDGLQNGDVVYYVEVIDPYMYYYYGTDGNASSGNAWVDMDDYGAATDGDAYAWTEDGEILPEEFSEGDV